MTVHTSSSFHAVDVARGDARSSAEALALDARRATRALGFDRRDLSEMLGVDYATADAIHAGAARIAPGSEVAERLLLLVRLHRALGDVHGSTERMDRWLDAVDPSLHGRPRELMRGFDGLRRVVANIEGHCKDCLW